MANRTDTQADTVHGTNPQYLVDRIIRVKIYNDAYWKEFCFGVTTESFIDRAAEIDYVGGTYGGRRRPAKFLCLFLKMLQIQPDEDVVMEYIKQADFKYLRALGAAYLRISARPQKVFQTLEPLFADYRKLRYRNIQGKLSLIHMDEFIDWLLREETVCDVTMPRLPKREILEESISLPPRTSVLEDDLEELEEIEEKAAASAGKEQPAEAPSAAKPAPPSPAQERKVSLTPSPSPPPARRQRSPTPKRRSRSKPRDARRSRSCSRPRRSRSRKQARQRSRSGSDRSQQERRAKEKREKEKEKERKEKKEKKEKKEEKWKLTKEKEKKEKKKEAKEGGGPRKEKDGLTVEGWDQVRKELGLGPLKK